MSIVLAILRVLRSRKLVVGLLCLLIVLCGAGSAVPQKGSPSHQEWSARHPSLARTVGALGLDEAFRSLPFVAVVCLLALSILACTVSRLPAFKTAGSHAGLQFVFATRYRQVGSLMFHTSLLLILVGATVSALTRREWKVIVTEGQVVPLTEPVRQGREPRGRGRELFQIRLDKFRPVFETRWGVPDYASKLTVIEGGRERKTASVRINEPLRYRGLTLYQGIHGFAPQFVLTDDAGRTVLRSYVSFRTDLAADPVRYRDSFSLPRTNLVVDAEFFPDAARNGGALHSRSPVPRNPAVAVTVRRGMAAIYSGPIFLGQPVEIDGDFHFALVGVRYWSEFNVVKDSGVDWVFIGSWFAVIGLSIRYFPRRRTRARSYQVT